MRPSLIFKKYGTWDSTAKLLRLFRLYWLAKKQHEIYASVSLALTPRFFSCWRNCQEAGLVLLGLRILYHRPVSAGRPG